MTEEKQTTDSSSFTKPSFWECDNCKRILKHGEFRFNCTICPDYNRCEMCTTTNQPSHPHRLVREIAYGYVEEAESTRVDLAAKVQTAFTTYGDRYCMGVRDADPNGSNKYADSYTWQTFKTIGERIKNFGHGIRRIIKPRTHVGICAANRPEWLITDFACILHSFISVPIYCLFTDRETSFIINNTPLSIIVCDYEMLSRFIRLRTQCPSLKYIICMDPIPEILPSTPGVSIYHMGAIERYGSMKQYDYDITQPNDCVTVVYTSGSTGFPKGAMISEYAFRNNFPSLNISFRDEHVRFCYRPLAWSTDRQGSILVLLSGGRVGFSTGDVARLMEELALVRPTSFSGPPTIWNKIYSEYKATLSLMSMNGSDVAETSIKENLLEQYSKLIPIRCTFLSIGGAMVSPAVFNFMKRCFRHCQIMESYGTTECGAIAYDNVADFSLHYRLDSVEEMGYTVNDKPFPRGELLVKTNTMFSGYMNNPEETKMVLTDDGFFRTGDIVELRQANEGQPTIRVLDRKKNFFKLAQGQYVSPEFLEEIYMQSPFVEQIYIHGNPLEDAVFAVVVPNKEYARAFAARHNLAILDNSNTDKLFYNAIMQDLRSLAKKESLRRHEIPSRFIIDFESFTPENGFLTSSMKLCRYRLAAHYGDRLKAVESVEDRLKGILERALGHSFTVDRAENFLSDGGDSLTAVRLSRMIQEELGTSIPLNILFESNISIEKLANIIKDPSQILSFPMSITTQLLNDSMQEINVKIGEIKHKSISPSTIFITGATGFVGAFLLAELLKVYPSSCNFICLVRCQVSIKPIERLKKHMEFLQLWNEEYRERIIALDGDLAQERFGLDYEMYSSLADRIDIIFHCGAAVNFILPYNKLYSSNVAGTFEVIRLATHTATCTPVQYISTISVLPKEAIHELHIDEISPNHLKTGYAQSKWVAEKLMIKASRLGLPINIYRLGSIWADTETGACNQNDISTLLLAAIMKTGCYPTTSFHSKLNGLPANLAARSIVSLSRIQPNIYGKTYHIVQSNDGISLQSIIENIQNCGIALINVPYDEWKVKLISQSTGKRPFESILEFFTNNPFECITSPNLLSNNIPELTFPPIDNTYTIKWLTFILKNIAH